MAKIETTTLVDDLDSGPADETVEFALDGKTMEIDLSAPNAEKLRGALSEYVAAARRATGAGKPSRSRATTTTDRDESRAARAWLRENGIAVADRGRIPETFKMAYQQGRPELARG